MKELPYFKFFCTEWMTGNIVFESLEVQGLFINVCSLYWKNGGVLRISEIEQRYKKKTLIAKLTDRFFSVNDGFISIAFLDEQLIERQELSKRNSYNGSKGGRPPIEEIKPTANPSLSEHKAKKSNIEKEEDKEIEKNKKIAFEKFWTYYPTKVKKKDSEKIFISLTVDEIKKILETVEAFAKYKPFPSYSHPNPTTYLNGKRWEDELTNAEAKTITSIPVKKAYNGFNE